MIAEQAHVFDFLDGNFVFDRLKLGQRAPWLLSVVGGLDWACGLLDDSLVFDR